MAVRVVRRGWKLPRARKHCHHFRQIARAIHVHAFHHRRLGRILGGQDDIWDTPVARAHGHRERAAYRTDGAIEGEFANQDMLVEALHRTHRAEDAEGDRQIETAPFLANISRSQIDGDSLVRVAESRVDEGALDTLAALADCGVGHADHDGVTGRARRKHIDFDIDQMGIDAINGGATGLEQRHWKIGCGYVS